MILIRCCCLHFLHLFIAALLTTHYFSLESVVRSLIYFPDIFYVGQLAVKTEVMSVVTFNTRSPLLAKYTPDIGLGKGAECTN